MWPITATSTRVTVRWRILRKLSREAAARGIGLMLDMVFNHTSTEHEWFKKALAGDPVYKEYYIFKRASRTAPAHQLAKQVRRQRLGVSAPV